MRAISVWIGFVVFVMVVAGCWIVHAEMTAILF